MKKGSMKGPEWVTFLISLALLLLMVTYLVERCLRPPSPLVHVETTVGEAKRVGPTEAPEELFVVPLQVRNAGERALSRLSMRIEGDGVMPYEIEIEYLGALTSRTLYVYARGRGAGATIRAVPKFYRLD